MTTKNFGKVPEYLSKIKKNLDAEKKQMDILQEKIKEDEMMSKYSSTYYRKILQENEIKVIKEGLNKRLNELRQEYGTIAHKQVFDTHVSRMK